MALKMSNKKYYVGVQTGDFEKRDYHMTLSKLVENYKRYKVQKVRNQNRWRVIDTYIAGRWPYIGEFSSKEEAERFKDRRASRNY